VNEIKDLKPGMLLEGTVTNVAAFGAFVDVGVHQDGLVHISQLADKFVKDPHEVVKAGDVVKVRVTEVDAPRKRIALTMRKEGGGAQDDGKPSGAKAGNPQGRGGPSKGQAKDNARGYQGKTSASPKPKANAPAASTGAFGAALLDAMKKK
jgi:uncharacterized protein